ncbi:MULTISPECIES: hypothetical protein [unclassified Pseudonocardia]|jgi:hypothetical protein|uniref:hypothetical protein n=1 Tax=unclassified Pseudonocardia TaxID=2619320 RepID=UPI00096991E2|nr:MULTISPECIES: hypothetical protein [unclassified Pseudonocardia]MBN9102798.1 hypothetical protein [Pseudonocardia sp.]OJY47145.1 MAG: hypothetical protein BGP03_11515 [Pseudonocardia sp. 73-21]
MGKWVAGVLAFAVVGALVVAVVVLRPFSSPGCATAAAGSADMTVEQADNAATIAGVGIAQGMPDHAVTVALATALQESGLRNLTGGDRDSAGLFQQRPSQGWGTYAQVTDPVHAATAFYAKLRSEPDWPSLSVTEAAQLVQRSAAPEAYARWEPRARSMAAALTGEFPAALTCHDLTLTVPGADVATLAGQELGTTRLSGAQPRTRGWAYATWLVAHAARLGLDQVDYDGRTWTASSGAWTTTGPTDGVLALHRATAP